MMIERFLEWWQYLPYRIDPVLFQFGFLQIRYYGLMYFLAFVVVYVLAAYRIQKEGFPVSMEKFESYATWAILGVIIGGRLGYVIFYQPGHFLQNPLEIIWPVHHVNGQVQFGISGMSYHGGLIGIVAASFIFCRIRNIDIWKLSDLLIPAIPLGYMFGRIGNFLNGELFGRLTDVPWGMYFPYSGEHMLRHPSQLYEAMFEGLFLFLVLWPLRGKKMFDGFLLSLYLIGYGVVRFFIEFVREPDEQLGFVLARFSMGQVLCFIMILAGVLLLVYQRRKQHAGT